MRHVPVLNYPRGREVGVFLEWKEASKAATATFRLIKKKLPSPGPSPPDHRSRSATISAFTHKNAIYWKALRRLVKESKEVIKIIEAPARIRKREAAERIKAKTREWARRTLGYNKMKSHIQFITTPTSDTPGSALLLHFDDKRYILGNVHEGLQRAGLQVGARFFKAKDFFLTGKTDWQTNGGLIGMILTLADAMNASAAARAETLRQKAERAKKREEEELHRRKPSKKASSDSFRQKDTQPVEDDPTVTLHGGPNLTHMLATARSFVFRKGTPIKVIEHHDEGHSGAIDLDWKPTWADDRIQVWAMAITPASSEYLYTSPRPVSPRKRSLGEFKTGERPTPKEVTDQWSVQPIPSDNQAEQDQKIREFVVAEMFGSKWRFDNLVETPLHQVKMPAGLFIRNTETHKIEKYIGPIPDGTTPVPNINVLVRQPWPGALIDHLPPTKQSATAMSYIIRNHKQRGKFKPAAANAMNLPPGPLWSALAAGEEVQSDDGKTITPDMVLEPGKEGGGFAIVELPSREYVRDLVGRPEWKAEKPMTGVSAIVWILGAGVAQDETLIAFMKDHSALKHVISSPDQCPDYLSMTSAASAAIRHNQVDPARYPIPVHNNLAPSVSNPLLEKSENTFISWLPAKRGLKLQLEPTFAVVETEVVPHLNTALVVQETPREVAELGRAARSEISKALTETNSVNCDLPGQDAELICLGTGSALPSQHRNVSATLLRVPGSGSYLLDCGENTLGQLKRIYSETELAEVLRDLKLIWISHLHADHHLGTASVVKAWYEEVHGKDATKRPRPSLTEQLLSPGKFLEEGKRLYVVGHRNMLRWLEEYSGVEDFGYNQLIPLEPSSAAWFSPDLGGLEWNGMQVGFNTSKDSWVKSAIRKATGLSNLVTAAVNHCYGALAVSLTFPSGFMFSYSGDCRPSRDFAVIGKGSTVLLHEATFDDELKGDAMAKKHSTTNEAIGVAAAMGARRVILTHFSQRYQKIPSINSMDSLSVKLEDADHSEESANAPVDEAMAPAVEAKAPINNLVEILDPDPPKSLTKDPPQGQKAPTQTSSTPSTGAFSSLNNFSTLIQPPPKPAPLDMKIGVAFDYMRVKVGDIIHLEKFNPAMRELYKEVKEDEKARKAAKPATSLDNGVKDEPAKMIEEEGGRKTQEKRAEKASKGQIKKAKREQENTERWEREKAEKAMASKRVPSRKSALEESITAVDVSPADLTLEGAPASIEPATHGKQSTPPTADASIPPNEADSTDSTSSSGDEKPNKPKKRRTPRTRRINAARMKGFRAAKKSEGRSASRSREEGWETEKGVEATVPAPEAEEEREPEREEKMERAVQ